MYLIFCGFFWPHAINVISSENFCLKEKSGKYISLRNAFNHR